MTTSKSRSFCGGVLAAAMALSPSVPALAGAVTGPDVAVRYSDIDVDTVAGATLLLKRIEVAADRVCARLDHGDLASRSNRERYEQKLIGATVAKVNQPMLVQVYESARRTPPRVAALVR